MFLCLMILKFQADKLFSPLINFKTDQIYLTCMYGPSCLQYWFHLDNILRKVPLGKWPGRKVLTLAQLFCISCLVIEAALWVCISPRCVWLSALTVGVPLVTESPRCPIKWRTSLDVNTCCYVPLNSRAVAASDWSIMWHFSDLHQLET